MSEQHVPGKVELVPQTANSAATVNGTTMTDAGKYGRTLILTVVLADRQSTITITPKIQRLLKDGSTWVDHWIAAAALSANGTSVYIIGRDCATHTGGTLGTVEGRQCPLPNDFRVVLTVGGSGTIDCYAEGEIIP